MFCSDTDLYPSRHKEIDICFNHMYAGGKFTVKDDGSLQGILWLSLDVEGTLAHLLESFKRELARVGGFEYARYPTADTPWFAIPAPIQLRPSRAFNLLKGTYESYGHEQRPEDLTFVVEERQETGKVAIFKIHCSESDET